MSRIEYGPDLNLQELRSELAKRVATLMIFTGYIAAALVMFPVLNRGRYPLNELFVVGVMFLVGLGVQTLSNFHPSLARHLLVWGATATLAAAMAILPAPWLPFTELMLSFISALLVSGGGFITTILVGGLAAWLTQSGARAYPLPILGAALTLSALLAWLVTRTMYTALGWAWTMQQRSDHLLELARDRQGELNNALKSLDIANAILRRTQRELVTARKQAEEARLMKEQFAANVSHELRTPLNMIIGFSDMILSAPRTYKATLPEAILSDIAAIHRNSQHLARLVDDILDLSRVEAGRMALSKEWATISELVATAMAVVQPLFESKGLYLTAELPEELPAVFCDRTRIRQVLINLLSNAGRFTERGGVRVAVRLEENDVVVTVTDTGPGIAPEDQQRLFEPFQQVDGSLSRRHGGTGLGLSISKHFIEMHGGKIWLESQPGVGTTVSFSLPLEPASLVPVAGDQAIRWLTPGYEYRARVGRSKTPPLRLAPRFALVEKGGALQRVFQRYMHDVEIVVFRDVATAVDEMARSPAQALVVNAPSLDQAAQEQLDRLAYGIPVITCWIPGEEEAARRLGIVGYLVKPVSRQELLTAVEQLGTSVQTVLIVDDDPEVLRLFTRMLSSAERGYRVVRASNGPRALSLMRERRPDVVLLDLMMPGTDGVQVLREKEQDPDIRGIPVIVVTARDPMNEPVASRSFSVSRSGGLSATAILRCARALSEILSLVPAPADPALTETPLG